MPEVRDWQRVADPHAVIHHAVQALRDGRIVAFPTETGYALTASGLVPQAVRQLRDVAPLTLAVADAAQARDWAPNLSAVGQRLARRLWPGPVTLRVGGVENGLASRLPYEVRECLCVEGQLSMATAGHESLREVLRHLPGPLVMANGSESTSRERADVLIDDGPRTPGLMATVVAVNGDTWEIVQAGVVTAEQIRQRTACLVLFVCTGNTCRSPLAEALCKKRLADRLGCGVSDLPAQGYQVLSAGISATRGSPAALEAEQVATRYGADLSAHSSQPLTPELASRADFLVGMTRSHLRSLTDYFGQGVIAPRLLDPAGDVADPIGGEQSIYDACGEQLWQCLRKLVEEIVPTSGASSP